MLADDVAATAGSFDDRIMGGAFGRLAGCIKQAQRFDLAPEVMRSAHTITHSPIEAQLRALALCRLPFQSTWFEWPAGYSGEPSTRTDIQAPVPKRMGALVTADDSLQRGTIIFAWVHSFGANICPLAMTFDWRGEPEPLEDLTGVARWHAVATDEQWRALAARFPRVAISSRAAVMDDNRRFGVIYNPHMPEYIRSAMRHPQVSKLWTASLADIEGEGPLLRSAIMLMNSRNLAEYVPHPISAKLARARAKAHKAPLLDCTQVRIKLSHALGMRAGAAADPRAPSRLHLVRGHFKVRRTGVYWWSPHARGHGEQLRQQRHVSA